MAYFLFVDESGQDNRESPQEVLAGVAVEDRDLWNLVQAVQDSELRHFGRRYTEGRGELKGKKLLCRKVFRKAGQTPPMDDGERLVLAKRCLENGAGAGAKEISALAQAKLAYVEDVLDICGRFRCRAFASIIARDASKPVDEDLLRKDYAYLFERFYYFLEDTDATASGIVVFDELERSSSHLLVSQMDYYFRHTVKGRQRAGQIIPQPFFVHSDLTTGIQLADLLAYTLSWGFRTPQYPQPRAELGGLVGRACQMRHRAYREVGDNPNFLVWSFAVLSDLRARDDAG